MTRGQSSLVPPCPQQGAGADYCCVWVQSLSHCELITDDGIRHLGNGACAHDRLEVIELDNCPLITDASLEHLKSCHSLERIELYDCQQITRAGIKRLRVKKLKRRRGCDSNASSGREEGGLGSHTPPALVQTLVSGFSSCQRSRVGWG